MRFMPILVIVVACGLAIAAAWQVSEGSESLLQDVKVTSTLSSSSDPAVIVPVTAGESSEEIGSRLKDLGVIDSDLHFHILVSLLGYNKQLQAGEYELHRGTPIMEVLQRIRNGVITHLAVTIPEGLRMEEVAIILEENGVVSKADFLDKAVAPYPFTFLEGLPSGTPLEGYLFPSTYFFSREMDAREVVNIFLRAFDESLTPELRDGVLQSDLTLPTILIIASIVEREAVLPGERPIIAQVFLDRLDIGMRLDADPTVQYAVGSDPTNASLFGYWKDGLTMEDLFTDSPYNTYQVEGAPPGPIASPGIDSIAAAILPADTNYLYFVAKGDGSHAFAETLDEHILNVDLYQIQGQ